MCELSPPPTPQSRGHACPPGPRPSSALPAPFINRGPRRWPGVLSWSQAGQTGRQRGHNPTCSACAWGLAQVCPLGAGGSAAGKCRRHGAKLKGGCWTGGAHPPDADPQARVFILLLVSPGRSREPETPWVLSKREGKMVRELHLMTKTSAQEPARTRLGLENAFIQRDRRPLWTQSLSCCSFPPVLTSAARLAQAGSVEGKGQEGGSHEGWTGQRARWRFQGSGSFEAVGYPGQGRRRLCGGGRGVTGQAKDVTGSFHSLGLGKH